MTTMFQRSHWLCVALAIAGAWVVACSPMKDPAEAAIADASNALAKVGADGEKYAPAEYQTVKDQIAAKKAKFDRKEYEAVLNDVHNVAPSLRMLAETVVSKKGEARIKLKEQWNGMATAMPASVSAVETKIAEIGKTHKLPKGVNKDAVAAAGPALDAAKQGWADAQSAKTAGNLEDAVAKGQAAQAKMTELMGSLGMAAAK